MSGQRHSDNKEKAPVDQKNREPDGLFSGFLRDHQGAVFALAYGKLRNSHDAEDIVQDVFIEAYRNRHKLKDLKKGSAWLYKATIYRCKDHVRKLSRRKKRELRYATSTNPWTETQFDEESHNGLFDAICVLPDKYRVLVMLRHFAQLSYAEISDMTGLPKTTIDSRLRTAKKKLRNKLLEEDKGAGRS